MSGQSNGDGPEPPAALAAYVRDGLLRQDPDMLDEVAAWCERLASYRRQLPDEEEIIEQAREDLVADGEQISGVDQKNGVTIVKKEVPCGKECGGCPHGPYQYAVYRDGDGLKWDYLGKAED